MKDKERWSALTVNQQRNTPSNIKEPLKD